MIDSDDDEFNDEWEEKQAVIIAWVVVFLCVIIGVAAVVFGL